MLSRAVAPLHGMGGLERHTHDLITHVAQRGVRVTLVTRPPTNGSGQASFDPARVRVHQVPYVTFPLAGRRGTTVIDRSTAYPLFGWRAGRHAARVVREGGVQLVYGLGASALGYAQARRRDHLGTVPFIFNPQGLEEFGATDPSRAGLKRLAYRPLQAAVRACARAADRVIATDQSLLPTVLEHLRIEDTRRVCVLPNAIDVARLDRLTDPAQAEQQRSRLGIGKDDALLLAVGRLEESKGFSVLISAMTALASETGSPLGARWRLAIVGDGPHRPALERMIANARLGDRVLLPGRASDQDLHAWYEAATLFVHPTLYEGSSLVTLEAMAHKRAIVGTRAGGLPDKVKPDLNGWLVAPGDATALAAALRQALASRSGLATMGEASRQIVEREFNWPVVADRFLALCQDVLTSRPQDLGTSRPYNVSA